MVKDVGLTDLAMKPYLKRWLVIAGSLMALCAVLFGLLVWRSDFFSRKHRDLTHLSIPPVDEQRWSVVQGEVGGGPLVVRFNESARKLVGNSGLPIKLGFAVPLNRPHRGGFPDAAENQALGAVEDLVAQRVLASSVGLHAMTLTTGEMKEFVFYIAPGLDITRLHEALRKEVPSHDLQCMAVEEPGWESFRGFVP